MSAAWWTWPVRASSKVSVSFSRDIIPKLFRAYGCTGCHGGTQGLTVSGTAAQAFNNIVNRPSTEVSSLMRIKPGEPDNSYIYQKIIGRPRFNIVGDRMPQGGAAVRAADAELLRQWILAGAPNN